MSGILYRCGRLRTGCRSVASTFVMRCCGSGRTGSVRCSPRRYENAAFINGPIRTGMTPGRSLREDQRRPHYLWRTVAHEGEVLEVFATKRRDGKAALKFLKRAMKRYGRPTVIVTDRLRSYRAAMNIIGNTAAQESSRWMNNRAENSHQSFRRREDAMSKFRDIKTLQKFASIQASIHNHFNHERHLISRGDFKVKGEAAFCEWQRLSTV